MKIVLIGNYILDRQQSMDRFVEMLQTGFRKSGYSVEIWRPKVAIGWFGKFADRGIGKWLGYVDKWILFSIVLWIRSTFRKGTHYHVCDHSNSPYLGALPASHSSITCHDVLAIRGALGHKDAHCTASRFGKILQFWILKHLSTSNKLAADSSETMHQLLELCKFDENKQNWKVIHIGFNEKFEAIFGTENTRILDAINVPCDCRFILHVGSNLARKNRSMLLKIVATLGDKWSGNICFAGHPMDDSLRNEAASLNLLSRIIEVARPDHKTLCALYSRCEAFIFPSYAEGFGWPVIEAQACKAVVIASDVEPIPEVSGGAALHAAPDDVAAFANHLLSLSDESLRLRLVEQGIRNCERFRPEKMIEQYVAMIGLPVTNESV